ncbi:DUF2490 domain-containing protein [Winogradskyella aurantiaca]|uniref:DUF2490 domain-containing protein n=1 Tax=Winogradskyella aurantiaca TaxID=2219558 RepID=UPI000E1D3395|nr:DUF2490 domain-containing protein [Winogradskyella aurantiaca]
MKKKILSLILLIGFAITGNSQSNNGKLGAWYMYFWDTQINESQFGFQGDLQYRNWNIIGDLEQLLLRGGVTYRPVNTNIKFTVGYAFILTGEEGADNSETTNEHRIYQEAIFPSKLGKRLYFNHRFRFEQRFVETQDFRTRVRYNLFLNIPLNQVALTKNAIYLALYNEIFVNGQKSIGNDHTVELFDRNRLYVGLGYAIKTNLRLQFGWMNQTTDAVSKNQLQFSLHHVF